jgi:hypothetical protein
MNQYSSIQKANVTLLQTFNIAFRIFGEMKDGQMVNIKDLIKIVSSKTGASKADCSNYLDLFIQNYDRCKVMNSSEICKCSSGFSRQ